MLIFGFVSYSQDQCRDILKDGLRDQYEFEDSTDFDSSFDSWVSGDGFRKFVRDNESDVGFSIPFPKIGSFSLTNKSSTNRIREFQSSYTNQLSSSQKDFTRTRIMRKVANEPTIDAWEECMRLKINNEAGGLIISQESYDETSNYVEINIKWVPRMRENEAELAEDIQVIKGSLLSPNVKKGFTIGTEWISLIFERNQADEEMLVQFILNEQLGSKTIRIKPIVKDLNPPEEIDKDLSLKDLFLANVSGTWVYQSFTYPAQDALHQTVLPPILYANVLSTWTRPIYSSSGKLLGHHNQDFGNTFETFLLTINKTDLKGEYRFTNKDNSSLYTRLESEYIESVKTEWLGSLKFEVNPTIEDSLKSTIKINGRFVYMELTNNKELLHIGDGLYKFTLRRD